MSFDADAAGSLADALDQLIEGDFQTRWEATKRLSVSGKSAIAHLILLLEDEDLDWEIRWFAARALSTFDDEPTALEALMRLLQQTQEPDLIAIAAEGLSHFGQRGISALITLSELPTHRLTAIQALASIQHNAVLPPLLTAAADPNAAIRKVAIAALGNFREPQVDTVLIQAVKDPAVAVRKEAIAGLGMRSHLLAKLDLVEILRPGLWDLRLEVNQATAIALGRLGTESAVSHLARVLESPHTPPPLKVQVVKALGWMEKTAALQVLLTARQSNPISIQVEIVEALSHLQTPQLQEQASEILTDWLQTLLATEAEVTTLKQAIALALGNLQHHPASGLLKALAQDADQKTALYAQAALRQLSS